MSFMTGENSIMHIRSLIASIGTEVEKNRKRISKHGDPCGRHASYKFVAAVAHMRKT